MDERPPPFSPFLRDTSDLSEHSLVSHSDGQELQRLVSCTVPQDELASVIEKIVSNVKATNIVRYLQGSDAQAFIDAMDEARHHTIPLLGDSFIDLHFNLLFLSVRHWIPSISHHESGRNV